MINFRTEILQALAANDETAENVEAVLVVSNLDSYYKRDDPRDKDVDKYLGKCVPWKEVEHFLNYEHDNGYGSQDCHNIRIWTAKHVYFIHEYDGSTYVDDVERNPT